MVVVGIERVPESVPTSRVWVSSTRTSRTSRTPWLWAEKHRTSRPRGTESPDVSLLKSGERFQRYYFFFFFDKSPWPINTRGEAIVLLLIFAAPRPADCQELLRIRGACQRCQEAGEIFAVAGCICRR